MKYLASLFVILIATTLQQSTAVAAVVDQSSPVHLDDTTSRLEGFKLNKRVRRSRKISDIDEQQSQTEDVTDLRRWKEEDYNDIMTIMSGGNNLRHRQLQHKSSSGSTYHHQKKSYYTRTQTTVRKWQKIALGTIITATIAMAFYVWSLRNELSTLNQYIPLGYKLFSDADVDDEEERGTVAGVEMH